MILFCGIPSEPPLALAIKSARERDIAHVVFNQRHAPFCDIALDVRDGAVTGVLRAWDRNWPLTSFTGIYNRMIESFSLPESRSRGLLRPSPAMVVRSALLHETINVWLEAAPCRVVNRTSAMASNISKPYQSQLIAKCGFRTPATLITNEPEQVRAFAREHGRIIYKSISSVRSIVREWSPGCDMRRLPHLPTQFQEHIDGIDVRVHVVGEAVFATQIESEAVDYRCAERDGLEVKMQPCQLSREIAERCRALSAALELPFCGIDLKQTSGGAYVCFEVNHRRHTAITRRTQASPSLRNS